MERERIIGIKVVNYSSFAEIVKIMRKYDKCSMAGNKVVADIKELGWNEERY